MRSFGVEEEFLLVDARTGNHAPVAGDLLQAAPSAGTASAKAMAKSARGSRRTSLTAEVQREQVEAVSAPFTNLQDLDSALRAGRAEADRQASALGARAVALGTSPLDVLPHTQGQARYLAMEERFGLILREQLMCGFHIHVSINSDEEGVAVLDRIRVWLPMLIALAANSPYWHGQDTGYASFRYQVWRRWPTAGPTEIFGSAAAYRNLIDMLLSCNVLLDRAMIYFDARLSATYPTVEVRVPDVCLKPEHATAVAAIVRALVETAAGDWAAGIVPPPVPVEMIRLASWRASRFGIDDDLIHPVLNRPLPAEECVGALLAHIGPALEKAGDARVVEAAVRQILTEGTGARLQRLAFSRSRKLRDVIMYAAETTTSGC
ncbi:carboxylate--amine ligase [Arthrobacter sp. AFG7.2]|uniref:carboxylate-amine ligase n=1 Tax=Arthrobacter sp. AFG7.2 TaxID=1688693 RepID=UPI000C9EBD2C|nr:glutamate--cysteine ligase [Arthrobacter sp. AFG7.2]PNI07528.1 carboxylate--amine ligase [Arthrobacter sp. AFG7.2]